MPPNTSVDGLVSGLSTGALIEQLMQLERRPQARLQAKRDAADARVKVYQTLNSRVATLRDAAAALAAIGWQAMKASSSSPSVVASASSAAVPGTLAFTVDRLASNHSIVTLGTAGSTSDVVAAPGSSVFLAAAGGLGFASFASSAGLAGGDHVIKVTQATAGAGQSGSPLASAVTIPAGATLEVALDGSTVTTHTFTLTAGTYTRSDLADMVTAASGGVLAASVANDGSLRLATTREGSAARLAVTGGTGLGELGLAASASASTGTDGTVEVDGQTTAVTDTSAPVTLAAADGETITASFSGGLRAGTVTGKQVSVGDGTLASVTAAINGANAGMTASTIQVSPGAYKLQIASKATGASGALSLDAAMFSGTLGALEAVSEGTDAVLTIGSGDSAFKVTSASNSVTGVLPGVTLTLTKADPATTVTVAVTADRDAIAEKVAKLVEGVNGVFSYLKVQSVYNADTRQAGPLLGDATARQLEGQLYRTISDVNLNLSSVGLSLTREGLLSFDKAAFLSAYERDPAGVAAAFHEGLAGVDTDDGLGTRLGTLAKSATDSVSGLLTTAINGRQNESRSLGRLIDDWDVRLERREASLRRQFTALETALSNLRNQSTWLAGQLSGLAVNNR